MKIFGRTIRKRWAFSASLFGIGLTWLLFCLPSPLFDVPYSRVLEDRNGNLLGARIAADGQWRFPGSDSVPLVFAQALITFEDRRFWSHPGVDLLAMARALRQNIRAGSVVSGGSTLSMQVIRMARGNRKRTLWNKALETIMAVRLELAYSKHEILGLYAAHAPFGGNVVGLEAAAWRYFSKPPTQLSRAEAATLAVLPNSPALIHLGRNRQALQKKRDRLLQTMAKRNGLDSMSLTLDLAEPLPAHPIPLPNLAPHLLEHLFRQKKPGRIRSTLDQDLQARVIQLANRYHTRLQKNEIHNLAAVVVDLKTNEVVAYLGNAPNAGKAHEEAVDLVLSPRSTGSILKPFLYAYSLQEGQILPSTLLRDIPIIIDGFRPENYKPEFSGAVAADLALARSLNVPFVNLLQTYSVEKFHFRLRKIGLSTIHFPPEHYGLSLILGGAEATLWDLTSAYAGMAKTLLYAEENYGMYAANSLAPPSLIRESIQDKEEGALQSEPIHISASASWYTFQAMRDLERPEGLRGWEHFNSAFPIAWKTGTSYGFRDAWAIGLTPDYAIGVWVGNADGEGRPGLVGVRTAAPVLFAITRQLDLEGDWFDKPVDEMVQLAVCKKSGLRALNICPSEMRWVPKAGIKAKNCPNHKTYLLSQNQQFRVTQTCSEGQSAQSKVFFVLPPALEYYYRRFNAGYQSLPPFAPGCGAGSEERQMELIYPSQGSKILVPVDLAGKRSKTVFSAAHRMAKAKIHWHLDEHYLTTTSEFHQIAVDPQPGPHRLTLVDDLGNRIVKDFEIVERQ